MSTKRINHQKRFQQRTSRIPQMVAKRVQQMLRDDTYVPDITKRPQRRERVVRTLREHFMNYHQVIQDACSSSAHKDGEYPYPQRVQDMKSYDSGMRKALANVSYATFHRLRAATFLTDMTAKIRYERLDRADNALTEMISKLGSAWKKEDRNVIYQNQGIDYVCKAVITHTKKYVHD